MFIKWIPQVLRLLLAYICLYVVPHGLAHWCCLQLLACITGAEGGDLVIELLLRLGKDYPHALYYPFRMSKDDLEEHFGARYANRSV